jgi:hypothetical protein
VAGVPAAQAADSAAAMEFLMRLRKIDLEGYLEINTGAGISPEIARTGPPGTMVQLPDQRIQRSTIKCAHCPVQVILNPDRTRERGNCQKCDHYICDECALAMKLGAECVPHVKQINEGLSKIIHSQNNF